MEAQGNSNGKESWWDKDCDRARKLEKKTLKAFRKGRVSIEQLRIVRNGYCGLKMANNCFLILDMIN
jgi:hypothetical protein